jgi:hypothetical protein
VAVNKRWLWLLVVWRGAGPAVAMLLLLGALLLVVRARSMRHLSLLPLQASTPKIQMRNAPPHPVSAARLHGDDNMARQP